LQRLVQTLSALPRFSAVPIFFVKRDGLRFGRRRHQA
jgi:hypothetical protein